MRDPFVWNPFDDILLSLVFRRVPGIIPVSYWFFGKGFTTILYGISTFLLNTKVLALPVGTWDRYWMTTFFCCVFTPPRAFCAVIVITLSPT